MTNQYILSVIVAIALSACNHQNDDIGWKLRNPEEEAKEEIITDSSTRFVSKNVAMRYDERGNPCEQKRFGNKIRKPDNR